MDLGAFLVLTVVGATDRTAHLCSISSLPFASFFSQFFSSDAPKPTFAVRIEMREKL